MVANSNRVDSLSYGVGWLNQLKEDNKAYLKKIKEDNAKYIKQVKDYSAGVDIFNSKGREIPVAKNLDAEEIWNSISPEEKKLVEDVDLTELDKYTDEPIYMIGKGSKDGKYHIYKKGKAIVDLESGNNYLHNYLGKTQKVEGGSSEDINIEYYEDEMVYYPEGEGFGDYDFEECGFWAKLERLRIEKTEKNNKSFYINDGETMSPLVVDYNQDGKVSAKAGIGVDIDGDGKADGAATDGDKMLAMSDFNGNGMIDGAEVFGNKTVNPFTGKSLNAKNGFEALKKIAQSALEKTGVNCFEGKNVNLNKLKQALSTIGVNLGFVSDTNNTQLENLSKINKINVFDYINTKQSGSVQHNQQGFGTSIDGSEMKVDDVWFQA